MTVQPDRAPYEATMSDGSPNLGSYEFAGYVGAVTKARAILVECGTDPADVDPKIVRALAGVIADMADRVQHRLRAKVITARRLDIAADNAARNGQEFGEADAAAVRAKVWESALVDRQGGSHTRARSCVYTAMEDFPFPADADAQAVADWTERVENRAFGLLVIAVDLAYDDRSHETFEDRVSALGGLLAPTPADADEQDAPAAEQAATADA
ncbi:hypothetical protein DVS28_b0121 (plasmid) [Euzebya pacifica]|uniref:Uncharacterized protein n=1 Tax=Euzebya pacifica TaxID=1608957 RepID=A0A346Y5Z4_9ACTN|nr:hypothetical protein [Euzebya pacifica]AXV09891.1 hypothetical protein DVS28_b0121 [Euzebya pacifica]